MNNKNKKQTLEEMLDMIKQFKSTTKIINPYSTTGKWKTWPVHLWKTGNNQ